MKVGIWLKLFSTTKALFKSVDVGFINRQRAACVAHYGYNSWNPFY